MKDTDVGKEICSSLEKKLILFDRYLSISKSMEGTLEGKERKTLGTVISERQDCIEKIKRIDSSMGKFMRETTDRVSHVSEKVKSMIDEHLKNIKSVMEAIVPIDRRFTVIVKAEHDNLKTELLRIRNVRQAACGYTKETIHSPRFLDKRR